MSALERLNEALAYEDGELVDLPGDTQQIIPEAARAYADLLANGERVEWCETHGSEGQTAESAGSGYVPGLCFGAIGGPHSDQACRIVSMLLTNPPTEEE